jgi:hypothetical protein
MMEDAKQEVIGGLQRTKSVGRRRPQNKQEEMDSTHGIGNHKIMEKTRINQQITTQLPHLIISFFL